MIRLLFWLPFQQKNRKTANTQNENQKQKISNEKQAHRVEQQLTLQAHELDDTVSNRIVDREPDEGMHENLIDGKYKKTIYVKTWCGKTIIATISPQHMVSDVKKQIEEKTRIPKNQQHLVSRGKLLKDTRKVEDNDLIEEETIELTSALLGGTKREESRPVSKEREAKRKASEPCIDTSGREENKSTTAISEETVKKMMHKMEEATRAMKYR